MNQLINSMNEEMIFIPAKIFVHNSYTLSRKIPAILLESQMGQGSGKAKLGPSLHLPVGSQIQICGDGFDPRTVKVRHHESYYFVFQEDLEG